MLPKYFWVCGLPLECERLTRGYTLRENCLSPSLARGETSCPLSVMGFGLTWACTGLVHVVITAVSISVQVACCSWKMLLPCGPPPPVVLTLFLPPLLQWSLRVGRKNLKKKIFLFLFLFFEAGPHLAEAGFEPLIFLPPPLKCWDYRQVSPTSSLKFCFLSLLMASSHRAWSIKSCCNRHSDIPHEAHSVGSGSLLLA